ncbi:MAG: hypothetical protein M3R00_03575 [Pseudomonadota bacterium]|nr:hypothetical protein [Pseudomonadota bacterium]
MLSTTHEMSATEFKATCLKVMDEVYDNHMDVIITALSGARCNAPANTTADNTRLCTARFLL